MAPRVAPGIPVYHLDPAAPWAAAGRARRGGTRLVAALAARVHLTFDDATAGMPTSRSGRRCSTLWGSSSTRRRPRPSTTTSGTSSPSLPPAVVYEFPEAPLAQKAYFTTVTRALKEYLARRRTLKVLRNRTSSSTPGSGSPLTDFAVRCSAAAQAAADAAAAKIRDRFEGRLDVLRRQVEEARFQAGPGRARRRDPRPGGRSLAMGRRHRSGARGKAPRPGSLQGGHQALDDPQGAAAP